MRVLRSLFGVVVGYLLFAVSTFSIFRIAGRDPHQNQDVVFVAASVALGMAFAFAGGYLAAVIAGSEARLHGAAVAGLLALGAAASILSQPGAGSIWSQAAAIALMAPSAFCGGIVRGRSHPE